MTRKKYDRAWHFVRSDVNGNPVMRDGRTVVTGRWVTHRGEVRLCGSGLHASRRAIEALQYLEWDNAWVCLVDVDQVEQEEAGDKLVCRRRRVVAMARVEEIELRAFARQCALDVIHLWKATPVVREYLETGKEEIRAAAWAAARDAAMDAAWDAARGAAWAAARAAARDAAMDAAWDAAKGAAWAAARAAAWAAARDAQNARLEAGLLKKLGLQARCFCVLCKGAPL